MKTFLIKDALTGDAVEFDLATGDAAMERNCSEKPSCKSIFFPGCSFINYAIPLVKDVYDTLIDAGEIDGISVLCCGKILSYEPDGENVRAAFEQQMCERVASAGIERIICACPNCVKALREAFAKNDATRNVKVEVLCQVLAKLGRKLDKATVAKMIKGDPAADVLLAPHDSCPDRETGEFAEGLRAIMPDDLWADPKHCKSKSVCCGSLPRAAGKMQQADKCAAICGTESVDVGADCIVCACMSCTFQLNMAQQHIPCAHYLEFLYDKRIDWGKVGNWMKLRFLFDETLGVIDKSSGREFAGLGASEKASEVDRAAAKDVSFSNSDVCEFGE